MMDVDDGPELDADAVRALAPDALFGLDGAVALVTGAGGGIGRWLAAGLGAAGARLVLTDLAGPGLDEVVATLHAAGVTAEAAPMDLGADDAPDRLVGVATAAFAGLDVLVNCAVVNRRMPMLAVDRTSYDLIMDLDLRVPTGWTARPSSPPHGARRSASRPTRSTGHCPRGR